MNYFERMITVQAPARQAFEYLRHPENIPHYVPQVSKVTTTDHDRIKAVLDIAGRKVESMGVFRSDPAHMRVEWHADDRHRYSGILEVHGGDATPDICDVMIHLSIDESAMHGGPTHPEIESKRTEFSEAILDELQKALELIRQVVQERVGEHHKFVP